MRTHEERVEKVVEEVKAELNRAMSKHYSFPTAHHGYAVILEELDELWDVVKEQKPASKRMRDEARQVAAMAIRFMLDLTEEEE